MAEAGAAPMLAMDAEVAQAGLLSLGSICRLVMSSISQLGLVELQGQTEAPRLSQAQVFR